MCCKISAPPLSVPTLQDAGGVFSGDGVCYNASAPPPSPPPLHPLALQDLKDLDEDTLRFRVAQLATEIQERTKWEALRLMEGVQKKEAEIARKVSACVCLRSAKNTRRDAYRAAVVLREGRRRRHTQQWGLRVDTRLARPFSAGKLLQPGRSFEESKMTLVHLAVRKCETLDGHV